MPEQQITGFPVRAAPNSRVTKDSEAFELLAVNATFDGGAAGADFLPAVEIISDSGDVVARHKTEETVAAGDSVEVTFAPFLARPSPTTPSGGGITVEHNGVPVQMTESTLNFVDGASRTINWSVTDTPGVRYTVQPVQVSLGAELQGADLSGGQLLAPGAFTTLTYLVVDWDTDTMANLAANNTRLTVKTAGLYTWHGGGYFSATALGGALVALMQLNGAGLSQSGDNCPIATNLGGNNFWTCSCLIRPHVGDVLTMLVENRTPGNVFLQAWRMAAQRLAP